MPIHALKLLDRLRGEKLVEAKLPQGTASQDVATGPKLNSGAGVSAQVDGIDSTRGTSQPRIISGSKRSTSTEQPLKSGDPLGWAARATAKTVKLGSVGAGVGLVVFGITKVLAGMTLVSGGFPLFAAGAGLALAGVAVFKLGGLLSKAIRGE